MKALTFEQAKDQVAVKYGFKDWADYSEFMFHTKGIIATQKNTIRRSSRR